MGSSLVSGGDPTSFLITVLVVVVVVVVVEPVHMKTSCQKGHYGMSTRNVCLTI